MTQATPTIGANKSGIEYRTADNDGKRALLNHHKGSAAPSYAEAGILWLDDTATPWILKIYDGADWIAVASVNATTNAVEAYHGAAVLRLLNHATDTGAANAYALAPVPAAAAYVTGQIVTLKPANASTGACTLAVSGLAAKNIKLLDGTNPASGALATAGTHLLVYDGTNFVLLNPSLGSAAYLTAGTAANNLVQLNGSAQLPAVSGALLTNLPGGAGWPNNGYVADRYYFGGIATVGGALVAGANVLYAMPFLIGANVTFTRVGVNVTTGAAGAARLGLYNWADGTPTTLVADFGTVNTGTTGEKEITISQALVPGIYAIAFVCNSGASFDGVGSGQQPMANHFVATTNTGSIQLGCKRDFTYAVLPTPFGGTLNYSSVTTHPLVYFRKV